MVPPPSCLGHHDESDAEHSHSPEHLSAGSSVFSNSSAPVKREESPKKDSVLLQHSSGFPDPGTLSSHYGNATTIANAEFSSPRTCDSGKQMKFPDLKHDCDIYCNGERIVPDIHAQIEKNVFFQDEVWTCYRRNYISLQCSYTLTPTISGALLYLHPKDDVSRTQIKSLGVCLTASMDEGSGKSITLVQHTAKRDQGPQTIVKVHKLAPGTGHAATQYHGTTSSNGYHLPCQFKQEPGNDDSEDYKIDHTTNVPPAAHHTFERVQFKQATQNNGRRRAQQQYYHLTVELLADIRKSADDEPVWVKIAHRTSEKMVVRGRSPGHYKGPLNDGGRPSGGSPDSPGEGSRSRQYSIGDSGGPTTAGFGGSLPFIGSGNSGVARGPGTNHAASLFGCGMPSYMNGGGPSIGVGASYGPISGPYRSHNYMPALPSPTHSHSAPSTSPSSINGSFDAAATSFPSDLGLTDQGTFAIESDEEYNKLYSPPGFTTSGNPAQNGQLGVMKSEANNRLHSPSIVLGSNSGSPSPSSCGRESSFNPYRSTFSNTWNVSPYNVGRYPGFDTGQAAYGGEGLGAGF
ncbi:MAG: hypothetical protein M1828_006615 [Chrysothrix sp. TS-e1954]|nr:MAG: hypothetical protein M1828_006615 [Chrysothrix sp. TS-e1954]